MNTLSNTISVSLDYGFFWPAITLSLSIFISYLCYPVIIRVSKAKRLFGKPNHSDINQRLMAKPNHRNIRQRLMTKTNRISVSHIKTPNLGGIGIFLALNLIITFLGNYFEDSNLLSLIGAITILFFTGLIDDLVGIKPHSKIISQVITALLIIFVTDIRISSLNGLFNITELSYPFSIGLTVLLYLLIINAYKLIDGIDGLAGGYAIAVTVFFGLFYFGNGNKSMFFLSISIVGSLISFLIFNFSKKEKIFMGDTGSLVIGFLLAYQSINFLSVDISASFMIQNIKAPVFVMALFSCPIIDTVRVFIVRIINRKDPFSADKNRIAHVLLENGLKHWEIAVLTFVFTLSMVLGVFILNGLSLMKLTLFLLGAWVVIMVIVNNLNFIRKLKGKAADKRKERIYS